jgi:hypothetical protein
MVARRLGYLRRGEAQDLHPAQWRLLRALVPAGPDDLFIVGDAHQRIHDNHVSLARVGVSVRGRSRRLTVNCRTFGLAERPLWREAGLAWKGKIR